ALGSEGGKNRRSVAGAQPEHDTVSGAVGICQVYVLEAPDPQSALAQQLLLAVSDVGGQSCRVYPCVDLRFLYWFA
ncbi:unnamed protein product, partial [marine sediment metagenome]